MFRYLQGLFRFYVGEQYSCSHPAREYEEQARVKDIAGRYSFPGGLDACRYERFLYSFFPWRDEPVDEKELLSLRREWDKVAGNNSALECVEPDYTSRGSLLNALVGAASLFNPEDIKFFVEMCKAGVDYVALHTAKDMDYNRVEMFIHQRTGTPEGWVLSPQTLCRILEQVKDRPPIHDYKPPSSNIDYSFEKNDRVDELMKFPPGFVVP